MLELPPLPFALDDLEPWLSSRTVHDHHGKLQAGYVDRSNKTLTDLQQLRGRRGRALSDTERRARRIALANSLTFEVSGAHLHELYWENLVPSRSSMPPTVPPTDRLFTGQVQGQWSTMGGLVEEFTDIALSIRGSGWAVLVWLPQVKTLAVLPVQDHQLNWIPGAVPLLICDVWEHAYYLDHPADRGGYLKGFWPHVNWPVVEARFRAAWR